MKINMTDLNHARDAGIISADQADQLWDFWAQQEGSSGLSLVNLLYYAGAVVAMLAVTWFIGLSIEDWSGLAVAGLAAGYGAVFMAAASMLKRRYNKPLPAGLCASVAICLTPLFVFGLQWEVGLWGDDDPMSYRDFYHWISGGWFAMEIATIIVGIAVYRHFRIAFILLPVFWTAWFMSMDLTPILFGSDDVIAQPHQWVSVMFGLALLGISWFLDIRHKEDVAFWGYLFGMVTFWGGLSAMESDSEIAKFFYFLINVSLMVAAIYFRRHIFLILGAVGAIGYLGHAAYNLFPDSQLFPLALAVIGLLIILSGISLHKHRERLTEMMETHLPAFLIHLRPAER